MREHGSLVFERQPRRTPIYTIVCETEPRRSIVLAPLKLPEHVPESTKTPNIVSQAMPSPSQLNDHEQGPCLKRKRSEEEEDEDKCSYPQVLLAVRLDVDELESEAWVEWIRSAPAECKDIKIDCKYDSFSTLLLVRMSVATWNLLPNNQAYSFVSFVNSANKACEVNTPLDFAKESNQFETPVDSSVWTSEPTSPLPHSIDLASSSLKTRLPEFYSVGDALIPALNDSTFHPNWAPRGIGKSQHLNRPYTTPPASVASSSVSEFRPLVTEPRKPRNMWPVITPSASIASASVTDDTSVRGNSSRSDSLCSVEVGALALRSSLEIDNTARDHPVVPECPP